MLTKVFAKIVRRVPVVSLACFCAAVIMWARTYWYRDVLNIVVAGTRYSVLSYDSVVLTSDKSTSRVPPPSGISFHAYKGSVRTYGMQYAIYDCPSVYNYSCLGFRFAEFLYGSRPVHVVWWEIPYWYIITFLGLITAFRAWVLLRRGTHVEHQEPSKKL